MVREQVLRSPKRLAELMRLRIPYAVAPNQRIVLISEADEHEPHHCPDCRRSVVLERKPDGQLVFAHAQPPVGCRLESPRWLHKSARRALFGAVRRWLDRIDEAPHVLRTCPRCRAERFQPLPRRITDVSLKVRDREGHRLALALLGPREKLVASVLLASADGPEGHRLGPDCGHVQIELRAEAALRDPLAWRPAWSQGLKPWGCDCAREE